MTASTQTSNDAHNPRRALTTADYRRLARALAYPEDAMIYEVMQEDMRRRGKARVGRTVRVAK